MISDSERREVARRLRRSRSEWSGMGWRLWLGPKFCAVVLSDGNRDELEDAAHRLADLIEPSEPKVKCVAEVKVDGDRLEQLVHDAAIELTGINRDALLALADRMEKMAGKGACLTPDGLEKAAEAIREALGANDG